ncbi:MAG: ShlB/FhaC/HecB family hemolysin secretion/activation protein, partial [Merismopedia sp. SIO2A8]|nr:ShlB/FhaC/HecB family hemolysin secretion/activation protein [Merismopedia sp. SIO2A8]
QSVTLEELRQAADAITQLYLNRGYLTSRAILASQNIVGGQVTIQVIEGRIGDIQVEGTERLRERYVRRRIALGANVPLRTDQLEDQLRLLRSDPLLENVEASLRAGESLGESTLIVRVVEADPLVGSISVDNYSPPSVGSERTGVALAHRNLTGLADTFSASYNRTTRGGSHVFDLNYRLPVNPMEGTVQLRTVFERNQVLQEPFDEFDIEGESERYEVSFRQPVVRSPREELAFSAGFSYRDGQTLAFDRIPIGLGANDDGETRTSVFRLGQEYVRRDVKGAWALRSQFNIGTGLLNATQNADLPDSEFLSWLGQAQRVERVGDDHLLIFQLDAQLTDNALLSSEQFVIGGGQSVRGFRQNARAGDNGIRFSVEDRFTLVRDEAGASTLQIIPFFDTGVVWNDEDNIELADQTFLAGIGLGVFWQMLPDLTIRLDLSLPLIDLDDRGVNAQDDGVYFNVNYGL